MEYQPPKTNLISHKITFFIGVLGVSLFIASAIIGGLLIEN